MISKEIGMVCGKRGWGVGWGRKVIVTPFVRARQISLIEQLYIQNY